MTHRRLRFTEEDREAARERYVSFKLPPGADGVAVTVDYDAAAATIDLGLFGPGGFRGYSGSARRRAVIATDAATPGYLPGAPPGEWQVYLGLHRVSERGVDVELSLETQGVTAEPPPPAPPLPDAPPARILPATDGRRWLRGDLHSHSHHSDGVLSLPELANAARAAGLDFLAVTDHNTTSHHRHIAAEARRTAVLIIAGQELTTPRGHANCFGDVGWIDWREPADRWVDEAHASNGLISINHPTGPDQTWVAPVPSGVDLAEVWHGRWDRTGDDALSWWQAHGGVPVGGSDFHRHGPYAVGRPTTWIEVEDDDLLGALRAGRVALSATPSDPVVLRAHDEVRVLDGEGTTLSRPDGSRLPVRANDVSFRGDPGAYRLVDGTGRLIAFTA